LGADTQSAEYITILNRAGVVVYCNEPFATDVGSAKESLIGSSIDEFLSFDQQLPWNSVLDQADQNRAISLCAELRSNGGEVTQYEARALALHGVNQQSEHAILILRRKKDVQIEPSDDAIDQDAKAVLKPTSKYRKLLPDIIELLDDGLIVTSPDGEIQLCNRAAARILGRRRDKLFGSPLSCHLKGTEKKNIEAFYRELPEETNLSIEIRRKSGKKQETVAELKLQKLFSDDKSLGTVVCVLRDITDLQILKSHLRHSQKLEAIGLLASGFAHNINSPLSAIIMTAEMAKYSNPDVREWQDVLQAAARITDIVTNMMVKTRQEQSDQEQDIDINEMIRTELKFLEANLFFKHNVELNVKLEEKLPTVKGLYGDFSQCFQNLVQNALDAMADGEETRLSVKTELTDQGRMIIIKVSDTGCGIPQEYVNKIFDPFFSTKSLTTESDHSRPSGTGLGLHTSQQLLEKYYATIAVASQTGKGTEFTISIPVNSKNKIEQTS